MLDQLKIVSNHVFMFEKLSSVAFVVVVQTNKNIKLNLSYLTLVFQFQTSSITVGKWVCNLSAFCAHVFNILMRMWDFPFSLRCLLIYLSAIQFVPQVHITGTSGCITCLHVEGSYCHHMKHDCHLSGQQTHAPDFWWTWNAKSILVWLERSHILHFQHVNYHGNPTPPKVSMILWSRINLCSKCY